MKQYISILTIFLLGLSMTSCDDFFSSDPDDKLLEKDYPSTRTELISGFLGISAKVQAVADHALLVEGIRGNLFEPTETATGEILDLYNYVDNLEGNQLANPAPYYEVILNANDYISHASGFYKNYSSSIDQAEFDALIAGALRYKTWAYSMIAKLYGEAIWVNDPLAKYQGLSDYPTLNLEAVMDSCINTLENGVVIEGRRIDGKARLNWGAIFGDNSVTSELNLFVPPAEALLTEFYLFKGNYQKVLENGFATLNLGLEHSSTAPSYQIGNTEYNGEWVDIFRKYVRHEHIFYVRYNYENKQTNRVLDYLSDDALCNYYLRPTEAIMDMFESQVSAFGQPGDKWRGIDRSIMRSRNNPANWIFWKYVSDPSSKGESYRGDLNISICRASDIHLWITEALVALDRLDAATVLFEQGVGSYYNPTDGTFRAPITDFPLCLRAGSSTTTNMGIRGRVELRTIATPMLRDTSLSDAEKKKIFFEMIVDETLLESVGEARGLFAMIRAAKYFNDPSIVADRVSAKYPIGKRGEIRAKLLNPENWFIKYDLKK